MEKPGLQIRRSRSDIPLWGGLECTINRVGDRYMDQLELCGHYRRGAQDIDAIAGLGIEVLRYPVLWERHQPLPQMTIDWSFTDGQMEQMHAKGMIPIVGLVHHGSGPSYVNFFDGSFERGLEEYAAKVARRYPEVEYYTPVNEPLTTARFCGLYGHWYPHGKSDLQFLNILLSECKATVLAMQAIRKVNPKAKLIQTEDLGKTYSTPALRYQAEFENVRRWLSLDLLCGLVSPSHPMWSYMAWAGIKQEELCFFLKHPCPPDVMGFNYYVTSERYLDERTEDYPAHTHGGNGRDRYADVEAVRVAVYEPTGLYPLLKEAWDRYRIPLAITEAHLSCTVEQQIRWFEDIYEQASALLETGVDIRGVTAWALFGSYGWCELLKGEGGSYESGAFDMSTGVPELTELGSFISAAARGELSLNRASATGWWEHPHRILYFPSVATAIA